MMVPFGWTSKTGAPTSINYIAVEYSLPSGLNTVWMASGKETPMEDLRQSRLNTLKAQSIVTTSGSTILSIGSASIGGLKLCFH